MKNPKNWLWLLVFGSAWGIMEVVGGVFDHAGGSLDPGPDHQLSGSVPPPANWFAGSPLPG